MSTEISTETMTEIYDCANGGYGKCEAYEVVAFGYYSRDGGFPLEEKDKDPRFSLAPVGYFNVHVRACDIITNEEDGVLYTRIMYKDCGDVWYILNEHNNTLYFSNCPRCKKVTRISDMVPCENIELCDDCCIEEELKKSILDKQNEFNVFICVCRYVYDNDPDGEDFYCFARSYQEEGFMLFEDESRISFGNKRMYVFAHPEYISCKTIYGITFLYSKYIFVRKGDQFISIDRYNTRLYKMRCNICNNISIDSRPIERCSRPECKIGMCEDCHEAPMVEGRNQKCYPCWAEHQPKCSTHPSIILAGENGCRLCADELIPFSCKGTSCPNRVNEDNTFCNTCQEINKNCNIPDEEIINRIQQEEHCNCSPESLCNKTCVVCLEQLECNCKTIKFVRCQVCRNAFHVHCAMLCFKTNQPCPLCRANCISFDKS